MRDFLLKFPQISLCNGNNSSGSAILYLQLEINSPQKKCLSVTKLDTTVKVQNEAVKWVVAKLQGDGTASFFKRIVFAKLHGDKTAPQSSMELYDPWISGPFRVSGLSNPP